MDLTIVWLSDWHYEKMSNEINLLYTKRKGPLASFATRVKILRTAAVVLLSLVTFTSIGIFLLVLTSPLPTLKEDENVLLNAMKANQAKLMKHTLTVSRLQDISAIITKRPQVDETLEKFKKDLPENVTMKSIMIDQKVVTIHILSEDLTAMDSYMNTLKGMVSEVEGVKTVVMNSMTFQPGQATEVNLTVTLL